MIPLTRTMLFLVLALVAASMSASAVEDKVPPDEKLIEQLGSSDFAQRERAARMLQARGPAALPALRKAKTHRDAEVRRRVLAMIPILETAAALAPKRVTLDREPRTLSAILQEIEKQTGYRIGRDDKEDGRYFRVEMKGVSFWEAVERIGRETGRVVGVSAGEKELGLNLSEARSPHVALSGPFRMELQTIHEDRDIDFTRPGKGKEVGQRSHRLTMTISILAEPRFSFLYAGRASVQSATDEDGKLMRPLAPQVPDHFHIFAESRGKKFEEKSKLSLGRNSEKARTIKVLRGTIPVKLVVERKRVIFTDNVLKAKGTKCRVREGVLEIADITRDKNRVMRIEIDVPQAPQITVSHWHGRVHLEDAKGHPYEPDIYGSTISGAQVIGIHLSYRASNDPKVGPPSKLIVEDWTTLHYAIPFEFKDVPLP